MADTVVVTSKHNDDIQYIWESNASEFSIADDPRGDTLKRGTTVSVFLKEEAQEFLEPHTLKSLVQKYSQFINFPIYMWESKVGDRVEYLFKGILPLITIYATCVNDLQCSRKAVAKNSSHQAVIRVYLPGARHSNRRDTARRVWRISPPPACFL